MNAIALTISDVTIRQDSFGRYFLNDLHKASGNLEKDKPFAFLRLKSTKELVAELRNGDFHASDKINNLEPIITVNSLTEEQGTYAIKEIVYAYAMWISAKFHIAVIRAYDALVAGNIPYGLKQLPTIPAPRAKTMMKGGLELHQQDAINDFIKERLQNVEQENRAGMAIKMYSAINTKFGTKNMKGGYKNIAPEHFDNIMQHIARLPLDEALLLTFTEEDFNAALEANARLMLPKPAPIEGELLEKIDKLLESRNVRDCHFPLSAADPHDRRFANAWLSPKVLLDKKNRQLELELIELLESQGHDIEGVKVRVLAMREALERSLFDRENLLKAAKCLEASSEYVGHALVERGKNVVFNRSERAKP